MEKKLQDAELKVMNLLWKWGDSPASKLACHMNDTLGWNKNTTYTLIKRCMAKGAIERVEPGFVCHVLVPKAEVQREQTQEFVDKLFDGSKKLLLASLMPEDKMPEDKRKELERLIDEYVKEEK